MALFLVSYDISEKNHDYAELKALLKKWNAARVLYSEWLVESRYKAKSIAKAVGSCLEEGDRFLVQELGQDAAWINLRISDDTFGAWLEKASTCSDD
jgi:CRISPR/Cas system-associated endoribonuclease Cas2